MFTARATALIAEHAATAAEDQPLFLYLAMQDVHEPVEVPTHYAAPFLPTISDGTRRTYAGMVAAVDEAVANVTASLRAVGMWEGSILVLSSDNGGWMGGKPRPQPL